jgi:hypothetical protein
VTGFYNREWVSLQRGTFCPHSVFLCFYNRGGVFTARYVLRKHCIYERLFHCTALTDWFYNREWVCLLRGTFCPQYIYVFCVDLRTNRLFHCTTLSECFYNRKGVCLLRGTFRPHNVFMRFYILGVGCSLRGTICRSFVFSVDMRTNSDYFTLQH